MPLRPPLCKIAFIANEVSAKIPIIPDHEVLRVIGRGAYGEIWLARSLTGTLRAVKVVYRSTFESEPAFRREFEGMCAFEPISRAHAGFVDILHVGRTRDYLYYIMELADDHLTGRKIDIADYIPRTLKSDLDRQKHFSAAESIKLGLSLTEAVDALHARGLNHRDIKPSNIIFVDGVPKLADIGLVAATGQRSFVGTEGYVPPEGPGTPAADIFSLGKVLYETCTGKDRLDFPELDSRLSDRGDKEQLLQLNDVLMTACANEPGRRYPSAKAMHDDLAVLRRGEPLPRKRSRTKFIAVAAAAALLMLFGVAVLYRAFHAQNPNQVDLRVVINTEPGNALVLLGDHAKRSPATFENVEPRNYKLRIMLSYYDPVETIVDAEKSTSLPVFHLVRSKGGLEVRSQPAGATVSIRSNDGQVSRSGIAPANFSDLPAGKYIVSAARGDWELRDEIEVQRSQTTEKNFVFANGSVKITSAPSGATVMRGDRELGQTPLVIDEVKPGRVVYDLRLAGYKSASVEGRVEPQQQAFLAARLERNLSPEPGQPWTNSLGMKFVPLGQIRMSVWETRVQDYETFCQATGRHYEPPDFEQGPTHPVVKVNWFDAMAFCKWLTEKERDEGLLEDRQMYRLPTDLEWSAAVGLPNESGGTPEARDGKIRNVFPWGKQWPPPPSAGNYSVGTGQRSGTSRPVGSFSPNALGIYDLGGNVWEWCIESYKGSSGTTGRDWGVLRGGSWATSNRLELQSSYRNVVDRNERDVIYGFRCVLAAEGKIDNQ